jgi:DNA-binding transcriptional ArsR family regulator
MSSLQPKHADEPPAEAFAAISSPVRRQILDLLTQGERPVNALAASFAMSRPAISQHLRILLTAGLVAESRQGRENRYRLVPESLAPVRDWIRQYERFWDDHLDRLQSVLQKKATAKKSGKGIVP